jgi:Mn-dependent DtxR family transcriptional regulator
MLSKPMIRMLVEVVQGKGDIKELAEGLKISPNRASEIVTRLAEGGFVVKQRSGLIIHVRLSQASFAQAFKTLSYSMPTIRFEKFLFGLTFRILSSALFSWKSSESIAKQLGVVRRSIQNSISILQRRGLLTRGKRAVMFNKKAWPKLFEFLATYRNFSEINGKVLWKFEGEQIFEATKNEDVQGSLTGFSRYNKFGVSVFEAKRCCTLPKKALRREEVFIHSLLQIEDARQSGLAAVFFKKHKLGKLEELAMLYDCQERLEDIQRIVEGKQPHVLPHVSAGKLKEMMKLYGV